MSLHQFINVMAPLILLLLGPLAGVLIWIHWNE
jgi:hypothetical protein